MEHSNYDKLIKISIDLIRQLEENRSHVVLKGSYQIDSNFLNFICKNVSTFLRYVPYSVNVSSPEF